MWFVLYIYIFSYNNIFIYVLHMLVFCGGREGMATHSSILALENPMDRGTSWATVHGVTNTQT